MATLNDIAKQAGVSVPTVSRILNPNHSVKSASLETEILVRKIAEKLDYMPNSAAQALSTRRTNNIGVLWDQRMDSIEESVFWSPVLRGIMSGCKDAGYQCAVSIEDYRTKKGFDLPAGLKARSLDGVILTDPLGDSKKEIQRKLSDLDIPFVKIWSTPSLDENIWSVDMDPNPGFRQALLHLYELGHCKIGYCVYPDWQAGEYHSNVELEKQIKAEFGIDLIPLPVELTNHTHAEEGHRIGSEILSNKLDITSMIMGDVICVETIRHLADNGMNVPRDFSVVALADSIACRCCIPQLTTIVQPFMQLGKKAVSLLADNVKAKYLGVNLTPRHVKLEQGFVVRQSTGLVPKKKNGKGNSQ